MANHTRPQTINGVTSGVAIVQLDTDDLSAAALTETVNLTTLRNAHPGGQASVVPANARIMKMWINLGAEFSGTGVLTCTIDVGENGGDVDELMAAEDIFTAAGTGIKIGAGAFTLGTFATAAYDADLIITTTGANVALLDAGRLEVHIQYEAHTTDSLVSG